MIGRTRAIFLLLTGVILFVLPDRKWNAYGYGSQPSFYLATDRSFGADEIPYVNLEGPGVAYEFRIYRIEDPESFLLKKIKERLVKEERARAVADPVNLFKDTIQRFRNDLRKVARTELKSRTRSQLRETLGMDSKPQQDYYQLSQAGVMRQHKFLSSFSLPAGRASWSYQRVPIPVQEKGLYLVEAVRGDETAYTLVNRTGINFVTKQGDRETMLFVAERATGKPIAGAQVTILNADGGGKMATLNTDSDGVAHYQGESPTKSLVLVQKQGEFALSDPDFYARSFYGRGGVMAYLYTDRPVYRPGDEVHFKGILRSFQGDDYRIAPGEATVDLLTEQGNVVQKGLAVRVDSDAGTLNGAFTLPAETYMGPHQIVLNYHGKSYSTAFVVEAYKKPTFLVKVTTPERLYESNSTVPVRVQANYYHGQPVTSGEVSVRIFRKPKYAASPVGTLHFDAAADYLGISEISDKQELVGEEKGKLDGEGIYHFKIDTGRVDQDYSYSVIATVTLPAQSLSGSTGFSVNRSQFFIQVQQENMVYDPGGKAVFAIRLVPFRTDLQGGEHKSMVGNREIRATLFSRGFHSISQENDRKKVGEQTIKSNDAGEAKIDFTLPSKGHYIVHVEAKDRNGNATYTDVGLWASEKNDSIQVPFKNLTLQPGKDLYGEGEVAEVLIMSPVSDGHLFVTLEGNRIYRHETIQMKGNTLKYRIRIDPAFMPNFTLSALQFSGNDVYKSQVKIVAPPIERFLNVNLAPAKKVYRPGDTAEIGVHTNDHEGRGVPSEISISVVDEAVYQIQPDRSPPITTFFYHPRRNNINTTLASAYRFFGYSESRRLELALRGRHNPPLASLKEPEEQSRENFKDTAYWNATVRTDGNGSAVIRIPLPENLTTWRVDVRAVTRDTKVGQGRTSFITRKNLMVQPGLPRYLIRGEKQQVAAAIVNLTAKKMETTVRIEADGAKIEGESIKKITVAPNSTSRLYFALAPTDQNDIKESTIRLSAKSDTEADSVTRHVPLEYFGRSDIAFANMVLGGKKERADGEIQLPARFQNPAMEVVFSPGSGAALRESLAYLADYPYGCAEQTMSRFMPLLAAKKAGYTNPRLRKDLSNMVADGLVRLKSLQSQDGGYTWFGHSESNPLMSAYVYRGLAISRKLGSRVEGEMINRARKYLYSVLSQGQLAPVERAYVIFSLSEGGRVEDSMVGTLEKLLPQQTTYGRALTALTLINQGEKDRGRTILEDLMKQTGYGQKPELLFASSEPGEESWGEDRVELVSAMLLGAVRLKMDETVQENLASTLIANRNGIAWKNSRDTSMAVLALSEKLEATKERDEGKSEVTIRVNGKELFSGTISARDVYEGKESRFSLKGAVLTQKNRIEIQKKGGASLYATAMVSYFDQSESFRKEEKGFSVTRRYYKMQAASGDGGLSLKASGQQDFRAGDLVMVSLDVERRGRKDTYMMVQDTIPPGFSFEKNDTAYYSGDRKIEYNAREIYDDRAVFFVEGPSDHFTIHYFLRAEIPGKYRVNPALGSLMYYPHVRGSTDDDTLVVTEE